MFESFQTGKSRTFVSGLFWQPLTKGTAEQDAELRTQASELKFDLAVRRRSSTPQVGFAAQEDGFRKGHYSAAAVVSKSLEMSPGVQDFLCAARISDSRWLYVAQREGAILPDGDIIGTEDEIKTRMLQDMALGEWTNVYAPDHWRIRGAGQSYDFTDFLPKKKGKDVVEYKSWWALRPVRSGITPVKLAVVALIVAIAGGGYWGYRHWQQQKAEEAARLAAMQKPEHPWKSQSRAPVYLQSCLDAMAQVRTLWPGNWNFKTAICEGGSLTISWDKQDWGWASHLREVEPKITFNREATQATMSVPLAPAKGQDEAVPNGNDRRFAMYVAGQQYRLPITLVDVPPPPPPPPPAKDQPPPPPPPDWAEIKWTVPGIAMPPQVVMAALDSDGFRIGKIQITYSGGTFNWSMEGTQYVQP